MSPRSTAPITAALSLLSYLRVGVAQDDFNSCFNISGVLDYLSDIGNGRCDSALNNPSCGYDGGDVSCSFRMQMPRYLQRRSSPNATTSSHVIVVKRQFATAAVERRHRGRILPQLF